jgi:UV DNA damage endonuclease
MVRRFGFCCKWLNDESEFGGMKVNAKDRDLNGRSTTMRWLREHKDEAEQRQWDIMNHNAAAAVRMIERVGTLPPERRMVRLGSEMLQLHREGLEVMVATTTHTGSPRQDIRPSGRGLEEA